VRQGGQQAGQGDGGEQLESDTKCNKASLGERGQGLSREASVLNWSTM
jgi:hypothetical protein